MLKCSRYDSSQDSQSRHLPAASFRTGSSSAIAPHDVTPQQQGQLQKEQLLKGQAPASLLQLLRAGRQVDGLHSLHQHQQRPSAQCVTWELAAPPEQVSVKLLACSARTKRNCCRAPQLGGWWLLCTDCIGIQSSRQHTLPGPMLHPWGLSSHNLC